MVIDGFIRDMMHARNELNYRLTRTIDSGHEKTEELVELISLVVSLMNKADELHDKAERRSKSASVLTQTDDKPITVSAETQT
jgi:uncharacterized coiled-coil DUF342 family protein